MRNRILVVVSLVAALSLVLPACTAPTPEAIKETVEVVQEVEVTRVVAGTPVVEVVTATPEPAPEGGLGPRGDNTLIVGMAQEPDRLCGAFLQISAAAEVVEGPLMRRMIERDSEGNWTPVLVEEIPTVENGLWKINDDGSMEITWNFKEGLKWSDGEEITANDVVFTYNLSKDENVPFPYLTEEKKATTLTAPDPYTLVATYDEYDPFAWWGLFHIVAEHNIRPIYEEYKEKGGNYGEAFVNDERVSQFCVQNGPFVVAERVPGDHIILEPNPNFNLGPPPQLDRIIFKTIPDVTTLAANVAALAVDATTETGLDFNSAMAIKNTEALEDKVEVLMGGKAGLEHLVMSLGWETLADKQVRKAIMHAIDRQGIVDSLFDGALTVAQSWLPPEHYGYYAGYDQYDYNPSRAMELLEEAGWTPGPDGVRVNDKGERLSLIVMTTTGNTVREQIEEILQAQLAEVGIELIIENYPARIMFSEYVPNNLPHGFNYWGYWFYATMILAEFDCGPGKWYGYCSEDMHEVLTDLRNATDQETRKRFFIEAQKIMGEDVPIIPLYYSTRIATIRKGFSGWELVPYRTGGLGWNAEYWHWTE